MNALTRFSTSTKVKYDVINTLCTEIEARDAELENKNASQDIEINKRVLQTTYDSKMTALEDKNTEQDTAISEKVKVNGTATNVNFISSGEMVETVNGKKFASNTDIIKDRANRTAEQINRTFYKQFCKEFTSDGADIVVGNGMDGYVLSGEIKGQTVKNYLNFTARFGNEFNTIVTNTTSAVGNPIQLNYLNNIDLSKKYKVGVFVIENTSEATFEPVRVVQDSMFRSDKLNFNPKETGYKETIIQPVSAENAFGTRVLQDSVNGRIKYRIVVVDENINITGCYKDGLSSTVATISNNGISYPIYTTETDKANKTPILLGGVGGVYDTLTINEDGSGVLVQNTKSLILNGSENWITSGSQPTDTSLIRFHIALSDLAINSNYENVVLADKLNSNKVSTASTTEGISGNPSQSQLNIAILKAKLATQDSAGFKTWLQANPLTVRYQLATPVTTTITKELMPTILTTKANAINLNSVVKASSLKVSLPVDRITELQSQVTALQNAVLLLQS